MVAEHPTKTHAGTAALHRGLSLLVLIAQDRGQTPLGKLAERLGIAQSTARRLVLPLEAQGLITRASKGHYIAGAQLIRLSALANARDLLVGASRTPLRRIARKLRATAHLGILENDMVTYLVKEHVGARQIWTVEGGQLEAYCSGIGKVLLAHLDDDAREAYIAGGPFVPLTRRTIIDPDLLRAELGEVRSQGYAVDQAEVAEDLYCVAVPVFGSSGDVIAAVSVSSPKEPDAERLASLVALLTHSAATIAKRVGGLPWGAG